MNARVFQTKEVQDLLKAATNLDGKDGNARLKQVTHRLLADLFKAIDDLDITPDEVWAAAHVDEDWNSKQWGIDEEVAARRAARLVDFGAAAAVLAARV